MLALTHMLSSASLSSSPSSNSPPSTACQDLPTARGASRQNRYTPNAMRDGFDKRKSSPGLIRANQLMSSLTLPSPKFTPNPALDMKLPMYHKSEGIDIVQWLSSTTLSESQNDSSLLSDLDSLTASSGLNYSPDMRGSHATLYTQAVRSGGCNVYSDPIDHYGLRGLLAITSPDSPSDLLMMTVGDDPSNLGLNLDSTETLPVPSSTLIVQQMPSFSNETLFYIFYSLPRDAMQNAAAMELYQRHWRYHTELLAWITLKSGLAPDATSDYVACIIFDYDAWTYVSRNMTIEPNVLEHIY